MGSYPLLFSLSFLLSGSSVLMVSEFNMALLLVILTVGLNSTLSVSTIFKIWEVLPLERAVLFLINFLSVVGGLAEEIDLAPTD